jgi:hypothetical protein
MRIRVKAAGVNCAQDACVVGYGWVRPHVDRSPKALASHLIQVKPPTHACH